MPLAMTACGKKVCETVFIPISISIYLLNRSSERLESFLLAAVMLHLLFLGHTASLPCAGLQSTNLNGTPLLEDAFQRHKILLSDIHGSKTADLQQDCKHKMGHETLCNIAHVAAGSFIHVLSTEVEDCLGDPSLSHCKNY